MRVKNSVVMSIEHVVFFPREPIRKISLEKNFIFNIREYTLLKFVQYFFFFFFFIFSEDLGVFY